MEFGILGPVAARTGGTGVRVGGPREQKTLAVLLLSANRAVSAARLTEALWGEDPPPTSRSQVSNSITRLRRRLAVGRHMRDVPIVRAGDGFAIELEPEQLDAARFDRLVAHAREQADRGRLADAAATRRAALTLWRGPALAGLDGAVLETEAYRLEEQRQACLERRIELDLALGRHHDVIGELAVLVAEHPLRENLVQLRMRALYRAGRRQDALDAFAAARAGLAERAGLDPGPELVALQQTILRP
jgi:DNA-binding SARP family transcriptional activator